MFASLLLLSSAFLHALWNALAKKSAEPFLAVLGILTVAAVSSLSFVPFFGNPLFPTLGAYGYALAAGLCEAGYVLTLAFTLVKVPMGISYTIMRGGALLVVWVISSIFLGEKVNLLVIMGLGVVSLGLYLTTRTTITSVWVQIAERRPYILAYLCALFIAGYHLCYGQALKLGAKPVPLFALAVCVAVLLLLAAQSSEKRRLLYQHFRLRPAPLLFGGFICALSFILFLWGLQHVEAGLAFTLRNTSVLFAQFLALALKERVGIYQWVGAFLVALGAGLVNYASFS